MRKRLMRKQYAGFYCLLGGLIMVTGAAGARADAVLDRGTYLMNSVVACGNCHTPRGGPLAGAELAGGVKIEDEGMAAYAANITPDADTGIGNWSDEQIGKAIREGIRPDGSLIGPPMPIELYREMSDSDVNAIIAYLRQVKPVSNKVEKSQYAFPLPPAYGPPVDSVADVPNTDPVRYGAYLAGPLGHCVECHTPMVEGRRDFAAKLGAGGFAFRGPWGVSVARNITPDPNSGLGHWSDEQIKTAITQGVRADGSKLMPPMPFDYYHNIDAQDLDAIVVYLRSLPPLH
jgi:mono/diheme cytochrome c family protein